MKKQKIRFYAALLCSSMVFSLVSTPVSAAETGHLTNPPTSTEGPGSPESASGNEAAAMLNGLYAALPVANGVKEVATAEELTAALENNANDTVKLTADITINTTLTTLFTIGMVFILGVPSLKQFTLPLIVGILAGGWSSVLLSCSLWNVFRKKFRKKRV